MVSIRVCALLRYVHTKRWKRCKTARVRFIFIWHSTVGGYGSVYITSTRPDNRFGHAVAVHGIGVSMLLYEMCAMAAHRVS
jgi:hypothetical protein